MHRIFVEPRGNVGNRMFQYAFASLIKSLIAECEISGVHLPEWGISAQAPPARHFDSVVVLDDWTHFHLPTLLSNMRGNNSILVVLRGYFQNVSLLPRRDFASTVLFPDDHTPWSSSIGDRLIINIRAGDILSGNPSFYPLVPISFYEFLVRHTGLTPVFVGQVNDGGPYLEQLRRTFSRAEFICTGSPMEDFAVVRSGKYICLAVSTFSWMAAWLSEATVIFYPVLGLFHPRLATCYAGLQPTNLPPTDDPRYRFFLFPLSYARPELEALANHATVLNWWREISANQMAFIRDRAPFMPVHRTSRFVNAVWYSETFLLAAMEIAEGWYLDPAHHYADIGRLRGYSPTP